MTDDSTQKEAVRLQYSIRSTFFYRYRIVFKRLIQVVNHLDPSQYNWTSSSELGITSSSWVTIQTKGILPHQVFCHPDVISSNSSLITYYRSIAGISQKGVLRLAFGVKSLEEGKSFLSRDRALLLARTLNTYICALIDGDPNFSLEDAHLIGIMNFGTQINGSWRNEIGREGSRCVQELLLKYFLELRKVAEIIAKDGSSLPLMLPSISVDEVQGFVAINGYKVFFGIEPDIVIENPNGILEVAIEVKAGIDPAGALERYGAAKKSFDRVLQSNRAATTIYLSSSITEGVRQAMEYDRLVRKAFNLTNIFIDEKAKEEFFQYIQWLMHL